MSAVALGAGTASLLWAHLPQQAQCLTPTVVSWLGRQVVQELAAGIAPCDIYLVQMHATRHAHATRQH